MYAAKTNKGADQLCDNRTADLLISCAVTLLISCTVTAQLICAFDFADQLCGDLYLCFRIYAKTRFSYDVAHFISCFIQ